MVNYDNFSLVYDEFAKGSEKKFIKIIKKILKSIILKLNLFLN